MEGGNLLGHEKIIYPLKFLGITHPQTGIYLSIILETWVVLFVLAIVVLTARFFIFRKQSLGYLVIKKILQSFIDLVEQSVGQFVERYFIFITSLFLFILCCNWVSLIPSIEEPTRNINTTLALGIISFIYVHKEMIKVNGIVAYLKEFFMPFNIMFPFNLIAGLIMLPLKLLGELATVISISFRLYGNIFGGSIITNLYSNALSLSVPWQAVIAKLIGIIPGLFVTGFFIFFEGFLQAFVFSILSLTNLAMSVKTEGEGNIL